jgi:hypothetical protein
MTTTTEYRIGERSVLRPGTRFRATGGPLYRLADGTEIPLFARGPFTFRCYLDTGQYQAIEATDKQGNAAILHIGGSRPPPDDHIIPRPYKIKSLIRKKARTR